jgi:hypothetical protein
MVDAVRRLMQTALVLSCQALAVLVFGPLFAYRESPTRRGILLMLELREYTAVVEGRSARVIPGMTDLFDLFSSSRNAYRLNSLGNSR